jgi:circadian clock protein KaiB
VTAEPGAAVWSLTLYISGASARSAEAVATVRRICDEDLGGRANLTVLNAADHPQRVLDDHILAIPTLVKHEPQPTRYLVGNLTDLDRVRVGLDLGPAPFTGLTPHPQEGTST